LSGRSSFGPILAALLGLAAAAWPARRAARLNILEAITVE
jgi:ABC-type antimicrobial peptide transport system permease subunit